MTVGVIPAAGHATRMMGLPKYLLPIRHSYLLDVLTGRIGAPCYIGANYQNEALVKRFTDETVYALESKSMPQTVLGAKDYTGQSNVLLGMPDTYWTDEFVYENLMRLLGRWDCAVALFNVTIAQSSRLGMCSYDKLLLTEIEDKPATTTKPRAWGAIAWKSRFWTHIHSDDAHMGVCLQRAINSGVEIAVYLAGGPYYDCGYPDEYYRLIKEQM